MTRVSVIVTVCILAMILLVSSLSLVAEAGSLTLWQSNDCSGSPGGTTGGLKTDGSCQINGQNSGAFTCNGGAVAMTFYFGSTTCQIGQGVTVGTGGGLGDGNACIPITELTLPAGSAKFNCNSAFLTASLSFFSIIVLIFLALFLQ